jgi:hypothetical protein
MTFVLTSDYLGVLERRMLEIANLTLESQEKKDLVKSLFSRYTSELRDEISRVTLEDDIVKAFNHHINNILSILETLCSKDTFKSMRRLILNEIHGCKNQVVNEFKKSK